MIQYIPEKIEVHEESGLRGYVVRPVENREATAELYFLSVQWDEWTIEGEIPECDEELVVYVGRGDFETGYARRQDRPTTHDFDPEKENRDPTNLPAVVLTALAQEGIRVLYLERGKVINTDGQIPKSRIEVFNPVVLNVIISGCLKPDPDPWTPRETASLMVVCEEEFPKSWRTG